MYNYPVGKVYAIMVMHLHLCLQRASPGRMFFTHRIPSGCQYQISIKSKLKKICCDCIILIRVCVYQHDILSAIDKNIINTPKLLRYLRLPIKITKNVEMHSL
jgi:hypothetical protein